MKAVFAIIGALLLLPAIASAGNRPPGNDQGPPGCEPSHQTPKKCDAQGRSSVQGRVDRGLHARPQLREPRPPHKPPVVVPGPPGPPGEPGTLATPVSPVLPARPVSPGPAPAPLDRRVPQASPDPRPARPGRQGPSCTSRRAFTIHLPVRFRGASTSSPTSPSQRRVLPVGAEPRRARSASSASPPTRAAASPSPSGARRLDRARRVRACCASTRSARTMRASVRSTCLPRPLDLTVTDPSTNPRRLQCAGPCSPPRSPRSPCSPSEGPPWRTTRPASRPRSRRPTVAPVTDVPSANAFAEGYAV